jgi:hypothetical protein
MNRTIRHLHLRARARCLGCRKIEKRTGRSLFKKSGLGKSERGAGGGKRPKTEKRTGRSLFKKRGGAGWRWEGGWAEGGAQNGWEWREGK